MDLMKEIVGITDVKYDCTVQELTCYINTLSSHFNGVQFSEKDVLEALQKLEDDSESDVVLVKLSQSSDKEYPWYVIHTRESRKMDPSRYIDVPC